MPELLRPYLQTYIFGLACLNGRGMALIRGLGLDLVPPLEGAVQLRGFVDMLTDFLAGHILHHVKLSIDPQQIPFDRLGAWRGHVTSRDGE